ncbi:MAG: PaaI family thioesterase [Leptospiraceae bacterium]|nr:PaaI family thioesterase [Leptospiraceae bacterium]MCK6382306.1 PaaI family thioesterase [Leptospiraceae bacterium]NUM42426.1 PaaI family thioesterase [Leptospiraceae bacterium]
MQNKPTSDLISLIDKNCPGWIERPNPDWDVIKILQSIIDQVLPGILKIQIESLDEEKIVGTIPFHISSANVVGYMHGGSIYSLGDTLAGAFLWTKSDGSYITVTKSSTIRFIRPFQSGVLECTVKEISKTGNEILLRAVYLDERKKKVCELDMVYAQINEKKR